jgi:hypothetical protein
MRHHAMFGCSPAGKIIPAAETGYQMSQRRAQRYDQCDARKFSTGKGRLFRLRFTAECAEHLFAADAIASQSTGPPATASMVY